MNREATERELGQTIVDAEIPAFRVDPPWLMPVKS
jgi:hypothetical protein